MKRIILILFIFILLLSNQVNAETVMKVDSTSTLLEIFISDSSSTIGGGLTGLTYNSSGLSCYYYRSGASSATTISLATMTLGTWASGGFVVVDGTNLPGWYQLGIPNAALATGATYVNINCKGAANMVPLPFAIKLVGYDPSVAWISSGTGTGQVSLSSGAVLLQPTQTGVTIPTVTTLTNAPSLTTADKQQLGVIKQITASGAGNTTTVIESSNLSETDSKAYVGNLINCAGATNAANKVVTLKIIKFDPTTDRITLGGVLPAALTVGDTCNILMDTLR